MARVSDKFDGPLLHISGHDVIEHSEADRFPAGALAAELFQFFDYPERQLFIKTLSIFGDKYHYSFPSLSLTLAEDEAVHFERVTEIMNLAGSILLVHTTIVFLDIIKWSQMAI